MLDKLRQEQEEQFGRLQAVPSVYLNDKGKKAMRTHVIILNAIDFSETVEELTQSLKEYLKDKEIMFDMEISRNLEQYIKKISK